MGGDCAPREVSAGVAGWGMGEGGRGGWEEGARGAGRRGQGGLGGGGRGGGWEDGAGGGAGRRGQGGLGGGGRGGLEGVAGALQRLTAAAVAEVEARVEPGRLPQGLGPPAAPQRLCTSLKDGEHPPVNTRHPLSLHPLGKLPALLRRLHLPLLGGGTAGRG